MFALNFSGNQKRKKSDTRLGYKFTHENLNFAAALPHQ